ncbi:hypothetical protein SPLC1_S490290 [Arthrospira platensis C1]|uniref:Uncharacterized protein n=1 Tax=Limnospira indica PCC 8005 TaxID=376219 RepID=A0A9P1KI22_9CYAN|nr:hypothetical protein SPLC1_S490290 [Arthrospira platensis C1]MDT9188207.1 hypothetical protein [Limnospira sp. PMC 894.15]CDM95988.1 conserved protein of unknown function [Limnospira indica PCC 8005]
MSIAEKLKWRCLSTQIFGQIVGSLLNTKEMGFKQTPLAFDKFDNP